MTSRIMTRSKKPSHGKVEITGWDQELLASIGTAAAIWSVEMPLGESADQIRLVATNHLWDSMLDQEGATLRGKPLGKLFVEWPAVWVDRFRYVIFTGDTAEAVDLLPHLHARVQIRLRRLDEGRALMVMNPESDGRPAGRVLELLSMAVEQSPSCVVITDAKGITQYVNQRFETLTGYTREEAVGKNPWLLTSNGSLEEVYPNLWDTVTNGRTWTGELLKRRKDNSLYWERSRVSPMMENGRVVNFLAIGEDISQQKALQMKGERLLVALEEMEEAVATLSIHGEVTYANPAFVNLVDCHCQNSNTRNEVFDADHFPSGHGCKLQTLLGEIGNRLIQCSSPKSSSTGARLREQFQFTRKDGSVRTLIGTNIRVAKGPGLEWVLVLLDVTSESEKERAFRQVEKMDALGALAGGISHDFNNVLSVILSSVELIDWHTPEDNPNKPKINAIRMACQRARELNRRILTFGKKGSDVRLPFDLSSLIKDAVSLLRSVAPPGVELRCHLASSIWTVGDSNQIFQIVMNLAVNGFQSMEGRGGVQEIFLEEKVLGPADLPPDHAPGRYAILSIKDQGCGMSEEVLARATEPFFTTKKEAGGSGMGLFVVHNILTTHGGFLHFESQVQRGTTAIVHLPYAEPEAEAFEKEKEPDPLGDEALILLGGTDLEAALMAEGLKLLGYSVARAPISEETFLSLKSNHTRASAVILRTTKDSLPADLCIARLRGVVGHLPIIQMVEPTFASVEGADPKCACDDFVVKPATPLDVARVVRRVLANWRPSEHVSPDATPQPGKRYGASGHPAVLLAEDSPITRRLIRSWLVKAGYEVWEAENGQEAWEIYEKSEEGQFDLVLTDIDMPILGGLELVQQIRAHSPEIPIVILSSVEDAEVHKRALHLRVNDFLEKPFTSEALLERASKLVEDRGARDVARRSAETVRSVRMAQRAMVAAPERGLPIYSVSEPLSDAGGDVFRCFRQEDGSILFVLADVVGHSVLSSYAVASFLGMVTSFLPNGADLRKLAIQLNKVIQGGPFAEVPVCALFGHWDPASGRLHVLNAGIPYGLHFDRRNQCVREIEINGTPLGMFEDLDVEERVIWLRQGDRLLFGSDGVFEAISAEGCSFGVKAPGTWQGLAQEAMEHALGCFCVAAQAFAGGVQSDDILVIAFEQGAIEDPHALRMHVNSTAQAIDAVCLRISLLLDEISSSRPHVKNLAFNILLALREAMTNAVFHGNRGREGASFFLRCDQSSCGRYLEFTVADEGKGFGFGAYEPPTDPLSERGRGLPFIQTFAQEVSMTAGELHMRFDLEEKS
jgi:PAS domain S-box-containing protein